MSKRRTHFAICGDCCEPIDPPAVQEALRRGDRYVHPPCGRVLVGTAS